MKVALFRFSRSHVLFKFTTLGLKQDQRPRISPLWPPPALSPEVLSIFFSRLAVFFQGFPSISLA